jgi:hypothetical protein
MRLSKSGNVLGDMLGDVLGGECEDVLESEGLDGIQKDQIQEEHGEEEEDEDRRPFLGGDLVTSGFTAMDEEVDVDGDSRRRRNQKLEGQANLYSAYIEEMNANRAKRDFFYALMFNYAECNMDETLKELIESVQSTYTKPIVLSHNTTSSKNDGTTTTATATNASRNTLLLY